MNRDEFLARVRTAAQQGRQYQVAVERNLPPNVGYYGPREQLAERLASEISLVGGVAQLVANKAAAGDAVMALVEQYAARSALVWRHPLLDRLGLAERLAAQRVQAWNHAALAALPAGEQRTMMLAAQIGITSCTRAIAESGTLLMASGPGSERLASLLPPVHVAVVERQQILPDLFDAFAWLETQRAEGLPSNVVLISGPSKTGDLEMRLVTGVHGPGKWHVIVLDDEG